MSCQNARRSPRVRRAGSPRAARRSAPTGRTLGGRAYRASSSNVKVRPSEAATVTASLASSESRLRRSRIFVVHATRQASSPISCARSPTTRIRSSSRRPSSISTMRNGLPSASANSSQDGPVRLPPRACRPPPAPRRRRRGAQGRPWELRVRPICSRARTSGVVSRGGRSASHPHDRQVREAHRQRRELPRSSRRPPSEHRRSR